jgi:hypothetical protein
MTPHSWLHRFIILLPLAGCSPKLHHPVTPPAEDGGVSDPTPPPMTPSKDGSAPALDASAPAADAKKPADGPSPPSPDAGPSFTSPACGMGASRLGPPTPAELKMVADQLKANPYVPTGANMGNNYAYGNGAKHMGDVRSLYSLTGDVWFLEQAVKFGDHILSVRNNEETGRVLWTGKREPCWPNNAETAPDAGVCGMETGAVANQILGLAKMIFSDRTLWEKTVAIGDPNGYGATYLQRARTYLRETIRSMDYLITYYVDPNKMNRLYTPTDPRYGALGPNYLKALGRNIPWNQQDMVTSPLSNIVDILLLLGEEPMRVAKYNTIVQASLDWFIDVLKANQYALNGVTVYKWGYNPTDLVHLEDLGHASADINALFNAFKRGRYGIPRDVLVPMANTFFELVAKPDGTYADHVDGKGSRATVSNSWTNYEEFRTGIVARLQPVLTIDAMTPVPDAITRLNLRRKFCQ